ncbi:spore coat protein YsxE [Metabacillus malikii]|uniref:Spore coat protein YsxE n=1 Tax=Metabacillus malikii TaxID=1504265 RepID=A0ABT9ZNK6_9BACI|nr:spore coat protein YsxE [Metabacillus malikii]MDQ0232805.1 spore coat protein YsxE [Metabacillus malikii]
MFIQFDEIKPILRDYNIQAEYAEALSSRAVKIHTATQHYVLKKLPKQPNPYFLQVIETLNNQRITQYVPIYKNKYDYYLSQLNNEYYYLMPYFTNGRDEELDARHQYLFKEIANLHRRTETEIDLKGEEASSHYNKLSKRWNEDKTLYEQYVEHCEKKLYLSPFELQALTYFIEVSRAIDFSLSKLKEWSEAIEEKKKSRLVLNHGKISAHHFLYDENGTGYLTNFEQSKYAAPIDDMLLFMNRTASTYPTQCHDCVNWFYTYQSVYSYTNEEMLLFLSYLAYPTKIMRHIKQKVESSQRVSELSMNSKLIKSYWHFKNIEYVVMTITETEDKKKMEEASTTE